MQANRLEYITVVQAAFLRAAEKGVLVQAPRSPGKSTLGRILRALDNTKPATERAINANVSFRTAQKLKQEGVL